MTNVCAKFYGNPSTKLRDIAWTTAGRPDGRPENILPPPLVFFGEGIKISGENAAEPHLWGWRSLNFEFCAHTFKK